MQRDSLLAQLREFGLHTPQAYMAEAFSRNLGFLTRAEQQELANATVAIPGMGGVGGVHLITLVRTGVGRFHLADFDTYEPANINRQYGASVPDFGRSKLEVMVEHAYNINPYLVIKTFPTGIDSSNIDDFLDGVQVVLDGIDFFAFDTRRLLFNRAREKGIYVVTAAPLGFSAALLIFAPHTGMSFDEYFHIVEGMRPEEQYLAFAVGLAPRPTHLQYLDRSRVDLTVKAGPSLGIACQLCSGMAATEAVRIILQKPGLKPVPYYFQFDPYRQKYRQGKLYLGNRNPIQRLKKQLIKLLLQRQKSSLIFPPPALPQEKVTSDHLPQATMHYIIRAGIQAPSGDNVQPWKFAVQGNTLSLYLDRHADQSFFNVNQIASIISCGAVLENMRLAATALGLHTKVVHLPSGEGADLMATVKFIPGAIEKEPLADAIWTRHTNRQWYVHRPLPQTTLRDLMACVTAFPGARLHVITQAADLKKLANMIYKVDRIRTEHRALHEHLHSMIRSSVQEALTKRDGLPLKTLEAGIAGEIFLKSTRPWWVMHVANQLGLGRMVALHSYQALCHASAVALLTVSGMQPKDFLCGGEALERLWLTLTYQGLAMQPMTAITLFWLRWQLEGDKNFLPQHQHMLRDVWREYQNMFPDGHRGGEGHIMLFRIGYSMASRHFTPRKNLDHFFM